MPKFESKMVRQEEVLPNGQKKPGIVVWIGVDDAAKATEKHAEAIATGHHTPANPNEVKDAKKRLAEAEAKEDKRRGR